MTYVRPRRIVAAFDASPVSLSAVDAVADIAAAIAADARTDLDTVFVEDDDLQRFAAAAEAWHADLISGTLRRTSAWDLEHQMRAQRARAQEVVERAARRRNVRRWTFRVLHGRAEEAISEATGRDLITGVVGWPGRRSPRSLLFGLAQGGAVVLVAPRLDLGEPVLIMDEGPDVVATALARLRFHLARAPEAAHRRGLQA
jgi:hypothetical protein